MRITKPIALLALVSSFPSCFADYEKVGGGARLENAGTAGTMQQPSFGTGGRTTAQSSPGGSLSDVAGAMNLAGMPGGGRGALEGANAGTAGNGATAFTLAGAAGYAGACGERDCSSSQDNDCRNGPDSAEINFCQCAKPNETQACSTGKPGACSIGSAICVFAADNTLSSWSSCREPAAGLRDCRKNSDNDCNGYPDDTELECGGCNGAAIACTLANDGIGTCKAGTPSRTYSTDGSKCQWECVGRQEATGQEICGPLTPDGSPTPDVGCDGVAGNGASCGLKLVQILKGPAIGTGACSCSGPNYSYANYVARIEDGPTSGWTEVSRFMVFTIGSLNGTIAVLNCTDGGNKYVTVGTSCPNGVVVGYVSKTQAAGYLPLNRFPVGVNSCSSQRTEYIPAGKTATGVTLTASTYFTVPIPESATP